MKECQVSQLSKNLHFDRVVGILIEEKQAASKRYFDTLISEGENVGTGDIVASKKELSPIEEIFHKHLKKSLGFKFLIP